ncbi:hypothetical protein MCAP1_002262 [Malassezia caprae]|uniref:Inositol polyphosphate-related phosphatase domain-containing protein n=1 Tax=Malassezia caprae TaxID=1381934 RepID=A0AAF0IWW1_9BASI|nr:hypothetical protein MCAP1_002262 [Malassezia caprae]
MPQPYLSGDLHTTNTALLAASSSLQVPRNAEPGRAQPSTNRPTMPVARPIHEPTGVPVPTMPASKSPPNIASLQISPMIQARQLPLEPSAPSSFTSDASLRSPVPPSEGSAASYISLPGTVQRTGSSDVHNLLVRTPDTTEFSDVPTVPSGMSSDDDDEDSDDIRTLRAQDAIDKSQVNRAPPAFQPHRTVPFRAPVGAATMYRDRLVVAMQDKVRVLVVRRGAEFSSEALEPSSERVVALSAEHHALLGSPNNLSATSRELRVSSMVFCPPSLVDGQHTEKGRFVWYGTPCGHMGELDTYTGHVTTVRTNVHKAPITLITRLGRAMVCVDESGKISTWLARTQPLSLATTNPETVRIDLPKHSHVSVAGGLLWVCAQTLAPRAGTKQSQRMLSVRCYSPVSDERPFNVMSRPGQHPMGGDGVGMVTCSAALPGLPQVPIPAMTGVLNLIWAGTRSGRIVVMAPNTTMNRMVKTWQAHRDTVTDLLFDVYGLEQGQTELAVCSVGADHFVTFWDAPLSVDWMHNEVSQRADTYSRYHTLKVLTTTYNLGAASPSDIFGMVDNMDLFQRILRSSCSTSAEGHVTAPDVIVFAFQELIDLEDKRLTAKRLLLGSNKTKKVPKTAEERDRLPSSYQAWLDKLVSYVRLVMPPESPFVVLSAESMLGLFTIVFVKSELQPRIRQVDSYMVKTGLGGRYGNKGAVVTRFIVDDSSFCFLNCHLAAGQRNVRQRNTDIADILQSSIPGELQAYDPSFAFGGDGSMVLDHEICLVAGDLNYRLDMRRELVIQLIEQQRYADLVGVDQLLQQMQENPHFRLRSFQEAPIHFAPTYKFNRLTNDFDTSEKARIPAYCDRILYRGHLPNVVQCTSYKRWDATLSDHRPVSATFTVRSKSIDTPLYEQVVAKTRADFEKYLSQLVQLSYHYYQCI